ncbi:UDP-N-acetylmuramyl tripeptide synthetase [Candidatus Nitrosoglobus terrae]|uniref:UDP-N-acetylmuramoyl-L-alanyl-D-glutamate--2,6-diaminopimelate ligase n=2 Tax=Candidatus Nitrosoglobus terrae TaxID=1630141 RepID=A0A1Q2SKC0_9GAMM|nr:UDP-N-acetylmuramyl tripeptide synthetase [Candidatus Nitrosoglobus terrae]
MLEQQAIAIDSDDRVCCLNDLLIGLGALTEQTHNCQITGLSLNSNWINRGSVFLACRGRRQLGHNYIGAAIDKGAAAIIYDPVAPVPPEFIDRLQTLNIPYIALPELSTKVSTIANRFYLQPSQRVYVIGVTGTNGKTSVSHFLAQALHQGENSCGLMGTLGVGLVEAIIPSDLTTPDAVTVQEQLAAMYDAGASYAVMEVSSHALDQGRVNSVVFNTAIFTNLSHEHLDYHGDMVSYQTAKSLLFAQPGLCNAVINCDDAVGRALIVKLPPEITVISYGLENPQANLRASKLHYDRSWVSMNIEGSWGKGELSCPLLGRFNAYNLLATLGGLIACGMPFTEALERLCQIQAVPGRMESMGGWGEPLLVVDYAHTPDALEQALHSLRDHLDPGGRLWCVFGCGGERDPSKRPLMGAVAERLADFMMLTDDNPRSEDPIKIIIDILSGMKNPDSVYKFRNRSEAIARAVQLAGSKDIVLIAGKGHENYQQIGIERRPFCDREQAQQALKQRRGLLY